jgi:hypothetical protein
VTSGDFTAVQPQMAAHAHRPTTRKSPEGRRCYALPGLVASWEVWSARTALLTIYLSTTNQVPMSAQQRLGLDEEPTSVSLRHEPTQPGQDRPVGWPQSRTLDLATQDRDLVSEHDDLDRQIVLFAPAEPERLEYPNEGHKRKDSAMGNLRLHCALSENPGGRRGWGFRHPQVVKAAAEPLVPKQIGPLALLKATALR